MRSARGSRTRASSRTPAFFERYVADHGGLDVTPGYYRLPTGDHVGNVLARLRTPPEETFIEITFPEGFTLRQMAARLADELPQLSVDEFLAAANDATIPAAFRPAGSRAWRDCCSRRRYRVYNADSERQVVTRMAEQMERVGAQEDIARRTGRRRSRVHAVPDPDDRLDDRA